MVGILDMYKSGELKLNKKNLSLSVAHGLSNHHVEAELFREFLCMLALNECSPSFRVMLSKINRVYKINANGHHTFLQAHLDPDAGVPTNGIMNFKVNSSDSCLPNVLSVNHNGILVPFFKAHVDIEIMESNDTSYDLTTNDLIGIMKGERVKREESALKNTTTDNRGSFFGIMVNALRSLASRGKIVLIVILLLPVLILFVYTCALICRGFRCHRNEEYYSDPWDRKRDRKQMRNLLYRDGYSF